MHDIGHRICLLSVVHCAAWLCLGCVTAGRAQDVALESFLLAKECRSLAAADQRIIGGLANGGLLIWSRDDPTNYQRWTADDGLTSNMVSDLAYSGQFLWVATDGGGLTRFDITHDPPVYRQFTTNIGGLELTSVTGRVPGTSEVVYYGIRNGGVGVINGGLPGIVYTSEQHGLVDDHVTDLVFFRDDLWIATERGISRFAANVFTTFSTGLGDSLVQVIYAAGDTLLLAGTADGVYRWDDGGQQWDRLPGLDGSITSLTVYDRELWVLRDGNITTSRLWRWDDPGWTARELPFNRARTLLAADGLWVAGEYRDAGMSVRTGRAFISRWQASAWEDFVTQEPLTLAVDGMDFGPDGRIWLGSQTGDAVAYRNAGGWANIFQLATVENDSMGLFADNNGFHGPNILSLITRQNGEVWFGQFPRGIVRYTPAGTDGQVAEDFEHITADNSALSRNRIVQLVLHPTGPLLVLTDVSGVDVLVEPDLWPRSDRWVSLPTGTPGLGGGSVRDAVIERNDVVWFAVDQVGIVRWDLNGSVLGPDDELTWYNPNDDRWDDPIANLSGTSFEFTGTRGITMGPEGSIWVGGGGGVVQFQYDVSLRRATLLNEYREKTDSHLGGLLTSSVLDVAIDANGDTWVACNAGLNRIRARDGTTTIDAYTSLSNFFEFGFGVLYSPQIITGLPVSSAVWELTVDTSGYNLLVGADRGAARVSVAASQDGTIAPLESLYLYPNPYLAGGDLLKLGGIAADVTFVNGLPLGGAGVEIFNIEGQLVYRSENVAAETGFWDGRNRFGNPVASGVYLVKVVFEGQTVVKTLAVAR